VRSNDLYLAYFISQQLYPKALPEIASLLAEKAEKFFLVETAKNLRRESEDSRQEQLFKHRSYKLGLLKKPP